MATKPKAEEVKEEVKKEAKGDKEYWDELVPFKAFKDNGKYKDDIFVGVNGKTWNIQRGHEVMIPRYVYDVLIRSQEQDSATAEWIDRKEREYLESAKRYE